MTNYTDIKPPSHKTCSTFIAKEKNRYQRKGYGLITAAFIFLAFFIGVPHLAQEYWPSVLAWKAQQNLSYVHFFLLWSLLQHDLIHLVCHTVYYIYYRFEFPWIERYKTNYDEPWPWHVEPEQWRLKVKKAIVVFVINSNLIPILLVLPLSHTSLFKEHTMSIEDLPSPMTLAMSVFFCMLCEDATFYWSHRFLHLPFIYSYIHKMHHNFNQTVSIAAEYTHPIEFALGNMIPTAVGPAILGP